MAQDSQSRKLDQYIVRFPDGMRDDLKMEAYRHNRSLNAEIVQRLQESLSRDELREVAGMAGLEGPLEKSKNDLDAIRTDIKGIADTLRHYRTQHMWRDFYCETPEDEEIMTALDFYLDDERQYWTDYSDIADDPRANVSRHEKIRTILANWLSSQGYLESGEDGALSAVDPELSFSPGYGDDPSFFTRG